MKRPLSSLLIEITNFLRNLKTRIPIRAIRTGSVGIADQAVVSGTSLVLMIVAARVLGPASFGLFALLYTGLVAGQMVQDSLIASPHNVLGATKSGRDYREYTGAVAVLQTVLAASIGLAGLLVGATAIWLFEASLGNMLFPMVLATISWQCHEFVRRVLYTESRVGSALLNDIVTCGIRLAVLAMLLGTVDIRGHHLLLLLSATWSIGTVLGVYQIRGSLPQRLRREQLGSVAASHWEFGRWLVGSNLASQLPRYLSAILLTMLLSVSAYGAYRAFSQIINAANLALSSVSNLLRPRLAREAPYGPQAAWRIMAPIMLLGGATFALFAATLILFRERILEITFGAEYVPYAAALFLLTLTPIAAVQQVVLSIGLQAFKLTRPLFIGSLIAAVVGPVVGILALLLFGLPAAGAVGLSGTCATVLWLAWTWRKHRAGAEYPAPTLTPLQDSGAGK